MGGKLPAGIGLKQQLARHHVGEELVVYPVMEKLLPDGNDLVSKDRQDHHRVAELLYKLQEKSTSDEDFAQTFDDVMEVLRPHLREEEEIDIPELEAKLSREESAELAKKFSKTKKLAPTRSHPYATSFKPPFETALALMTAPIDKVFLGMIDSYRSWTSFGRSRMMNRSGDIHGCQGMLHIHKKLDHTRNWIIQEIGS